MRGFVGDNNLYERNGYPHVFAEEGPLPSDVSYDAKATNRRIALRETAERERDFKRYELVGDFAKGAPTYRRQLSETEARTLVERGIAWNCKECTGDNTLHLWAGRFRSDVESAIGGETR